jgi:hypothetical protein
MCKQHHHDQATTVALFRAINGYIGNVAQAPAK